jgi:dephospho-CoA kinase
MMKRIGLTGNIGSGKTLVSEIFKTLNIPVFNADIEARKLLDCPEIIRQLVEIFGNDIMLNEKIDRPKLASAVFNHPHQLQKLNSIIHPEVRKRFDNWAEVFTDCTYLIYEAAILFESDFFRKLDGTILVTAPEEIRIERVMKRDHVSKAQVLARIKNQWTDEEKGKLADFLISNDGKKLLIPQVLLIHSKIIQS